MFRFLERSRCRICHQEVLIKPGTPAFCEQHQPLYEARQREGVTTEELSHEWADSLKNWRERPAALDVEQRPGHSTTLWLFHQRDNEWVLFHQSDTAGDHQASRFLNWLAVNSHTWEIRQVIGPEAAGKSLAVLTDRQQIEMAERLQARLARRNQPESASFHTRPRRSYLDEQHRLSLPALVENLAFEVYGLVDNPLGLSVCSVSWGRSGGPHLTSFGVTYSSPRYPRVRENFELSSRDAKDRGVAFRSPAQGSSPLWQGECRIAGKLFTGEICHRPFPKAMARQLPPSFVQEEEGRTRFSLKGEATVLSGTFRGPSVEEVLLLLQGLVVLNDRADLLEQHQRELDQERKRLLGG
jgi:hypothetical protein